MLDVLDRVRQLFRVEETDAVTRYRELVRRLGEPDGRAPDPARVAAVLKEAGKSVEDAERDVATFRARVALRAKVDRRAAAQAEHAEVDGQFKAARETYQRAQEEFRAASEPLYQRADALRQEAEAAERAQESLVNGCPYPELAEALNAARQEALLNGNQVMQLEALKRKLADEMRLAMRSAFPEAGERPEDPDLADLGTRADAFRAGGHTKMQEHLQQARKAKRGIVQIEADMPGLRAVHEKSMDRVRELESQALNP